MHIASIPSIIASIGSGDKYRSFPFLVLEVVNCSQQSPFALRLYYRTYRESGFLTTIRL